MNTAYTVVEKETMKPTTSRSTNVRNLTYTRSLHIFQSYRIWSPSPSAYCF